MSSGVVNFCIFGNNPMYSVGAIKQAQLFNAFSQDGPVKWSLRYYVGKSVSEATVVTLEALGAVTIPMFGLPEDQTSTFWRFDGFKSEYDYYLVRDTDSRLCEREKACILEWIESGLPYHIIRDHPYHGVPVLAGLWGSTLEVRSEVERTLPIVPPDGFYKDVNKYVNHTYYHSNDFYQVDQWWLRMKLYPLMRNRICAHTEMVGAFEPRTQRRKLPHTRRPGEFVGKGWDEFDRERHPEHSELVNTPT